MAGSERSLDVPKPAKRRRGKGSTDATPAAAPKPEPVAPDQSVRQAAPARGRNVTGFSAQAPVAQPKPRQSSATKPKRRTATKPSAPVEPPSTVTRERVQAATQNALVRVHTTVSVEVASRLRDRSAVTQQTHTEILAEAFIGHGPTLVDEFDARQRSQFEAFGFRRTRPKPRQGRMTATFYMPEPARTNLDAMANEAGFDSRSAFIDALLRRQMGLPD